VHHCCAQGLPQLEPAILDQLFFPNVLLLTSVHPQEEVTRHARDALSACIMAALQPLRRWVGVRGQTCKCKDAARSTRTCVACGCCACSYLAFYKAYQPLLALNVDAYVGALAMRGTDLSLADITKEVALHTAQLASMEEQLQGSVWLGLVQVNCNKVGRGRSQPAHREGMRRRWRTPPCSLIHTHAPMP
jgi:hypothetical protein